MLCRAFNEGTPEFLGKRFAFLGGYGSINMKVALVPHQHSRDVVGAACVDNFLVQGFHDLEGTLRCNRIYKHVAMNAYTASEWEDGGFVLHAVIIILSEYYFLKSYNT